MPSTEFSFFVFKLKQRIILKYAYAKPYFKVGKLIEIKFGSCHICNRTSK